MTAKCPCCGSAVATMPLTEVIARTLPPTPAEVLRAMAKDFGAFVATNEIATRVWGLDPNGGPMSANVIVSQAVRKMRPVLAHHGLAVDGQAYRGYRVRAA